MTDGTTTAPSHSDARDSLPARFLRLEGLALFAAALILYLDADFSILALALLALAPDLSLLGFLAGPRAGAISYDIVHWEALPIALAAGGVLGGWDVGVQLGLIWLAHIGIDRFLGFGMRYRAGFTETHIQRL